MATYEDVMRIDPTSYAEEARNWRTAADGLRDRGVDLEQKIKKLDGWQGAAAESAKAKLSGYRKQYSDVADAMSKIPPVLEEAARRIGDARRDLLRVNEDAERVGLRIEHDGRIAIPPGTTGRGFAETYQRLQDGMRNAIDAATRADGDAAAALRRLSAQSAGFASPDQATVMATATAIPARGAAPADVKKWWDTLSPMQQESLLFTHAGQIGALDGVPTVVRDRANRSRLVELTGQLQAEKQRLDAQFGHLDLRAKGRLDEINDKLRGIEAIASRLNGNQNTFLLGIDTAGTGRAIIAAGNPDTATNVVTYVPGTGAKLGDSASAIERSDSMAEAARRVSAVPTAAISWMGYEAPQSIPAAILTGYAENAAQDLRRFEDGLRVTHQGAPSHNTVLGHSYGSTVIGHTAMSGGINANEMVFVGSPGVQASNAGELGFPTDHVYATVAKHDSIQVTNDYQSYDDPVTRGLDPHGPDPADPRFGGRVFASDPGTPGSVPGFPYSGAAHSEYWKPYGRSLDNIGRIIAGQGPK